MQWLLLACTVNGAIGIFLCVVVVTFRRRLSLERWLDRAAERQRSTAPAVAVVIAARNEQHDVERTLREFVSLPGIAEIILVDDGSEDNTLAIARAIAAEDSRIRVLEAPPLPQGWVGKTHALHWASKRVTADFILFTDADVHLNGLPLRAIISRMAMDGLDHVGGNFRIEASQATEALTAPVLGTIAFVALGLSAARNGSSTGAFNLVRTSAYRQIHGHLPIRDHVVDDVALARCLKSQGHRSRFIDVSPVLSVRLFKGFRGFASAVSRSAVPFLGSGPSRALILSLLGIVLSTSLLISLVVLISALAAGPTAASWPWHSAYRIILAGYIGSVLPFVLANRLHSRSRWWGMASPLALVIMTTAVAIASIRCMLGLTVRWRGRAYPYIGRTRASSKRRSLK